MQPEVIEDFSNAEQAYGDDFGCCCNLPRKIDNLVRGSIMISEEPAKQVCTGHWYSLHYKYSLHFGASNGSCPLHFLKKLCNGSEYIWFLKPLLT